MYRRGDLRADIVPLAIGLPGIYLVLCGGVLHRGWFNIPAFVLIVTATLIQLANARRASRKATKDGSD